MYWLGGLIAGAFLNIVGSLVGRVLVAVGMGVVSFTGITALLNYFKGLAVSNLLALPPGVLGILSIMKVGTCISMVFSAMLIRFTIQGMTSDTFKTWVKK